MTNEKRGGFTVVAFNRSDFKAIHAEIFKQISAGHILWEAKNCSANPVSLIWKQ